MTDHQFIYCTWKISRINRGSHKQIKFCSFKHYAIDLLRKELPKINFPNYQNYNDINKGYNEFIQKIMAVIDNIAPIIERQIKQNPQEWFHGEITDEIYYSKSLKNQNYTLIKIPIMQQDVYYKK